MKRISEALREIASIADVISDDNAEARKDRLEIKLMLESMLQQIAPTVARTSTETADHEQRLQQIEKRFFNGSGLSS